MYSEDLPERWQAILSELNDAQKTAVLHDMGPLVVFAGAGSGKTKVIASRIALLLEKGVPPSAILAVTFTNKAAKELRERVIRYGRDGKWVQVATFHSACARWLREFATELGFRNDFTIYDDADCKQALKLLFKQQFNFNFDKDAISEYLHAIAQAKTACLSPERAKYQNQSNTPECWDKVYEIYQKYLKQAQAMDFADLLMNMVLLLQNSQEVRQILQQRYQYILVDEYQDTNVTQIRLIDLLLNPNKNLCVVGDDDQAIYSWRGADPSHILNFKEQYPKAQEIRLEQNYRSTGNIIKAANALIQKNKIRAEKKLWTENAPGDPLSYQLCYDGELEASAIIDSILTEEKTFSYPNIALFYRTNAQSRVFEDSLRKARIPYRIYGSLRFYDRAEIKDVIAYFRLALTPEDDMAFLRIVNVPARGIGKKALEMIEQKAACEGSSLLKASLDLGQTDNSSTANKIRQFAELMTNLGKDLRKAQSKDALAIFLQKVDYFSHLQKKHPAEVDEKIANVHELGAALAEWSAERNGNNDQLVEWMHEVSLLGSEDESVAGVSLMTLHSAKGLEFPRVYIAGVEDGLIPHRSGCDPKAALEEERRLFYVGLTRAKKKVGLYGARRRRVYNQWMANPPSRFLAELPQELFKAAQGSAVAAKPSGTTSIRQGAYVSHSTFGKGIVEDVQEEFGRLKAVVDFAEFGPRTIPAQHLKMIAKM